MDAMRRVWGAACLVAAAWLAGCGGGGEGPAAPVPPPAVTPPVITQQPAAQTVAAGGSATFSVTATGNGLAYAWQRSTNGGLAYAPIAGATAATLTIGPVDASMNAHRFVVIVQNGAGIVTSHPATLTVTPVASAPGFTTQPADQAVTAPAPATFTVAVSGTPAPTIAWESSSDNGATWSAIAGASGTSYTTPATTAGDNGRQFRAVATNASSSTNSNPGRLSVNASPSGSAFVYTANAGSLLVTGYAVDRATGAVTTTPGSPYAGAQAAVTGLVLHPNGRFLYALASDRTWLFLIDPADGRLTLGAGSPFATPRMVAGTPFIDPAGRLLVYNTGQLSSFAIDATTGALTPAGAVVLGLGSEQVEFSPDSSLMFVNDGAGNLRVLRTNPLTLLTDPSTTVRLHGGSRLHARNGFIVAQPLGAGLASYAVGADGALTPVQTISVREGGFVSHPNGRCLYQTSLVNGNPPTQSVTVTPVVFDLNTGTLTARPEVRIAVPGPGARNSYPLQIEPGGSFGYMTTLAGQLGNPVTPVALDGATCGIGAGTPFDPGVDLSVNYVVDTSGTVFVGYLGGQPSLRVARIDPVTRVPVPVAGSPFTTSGGMLRGQVVIR